jgi:hypothetical protein
VYLTTRYSTGAAPIVPGGAGGNGFGVSGSSGVSGSVGHVISGTA